MICVGPSTASGGLDPFFYAREAAVSLDLILLYFPRLPFSYADHADCFDPGCFTFLLIWFGFSRLGRRLSVDFTVARDPSTAVFVV